jgi:hypothetical protein
MALRHVIVTKRDSRGVGREISWAHDEKIWKDVKIQEKKKSAHDGYLWAC